MSGVTTANEDVLIMPPMTGAETDMGYRIWRTGGVGALANTARKEAGQHNNCKTIVVNFTHSYKVLAPLLFLITSAAIPASSDCYTQLFCPYKSAAVEAVMMRGEEGTTSDADD